MPMPDESLDRARTDESLAIERAKSDAAIAEKTLADELADQVVDRAREQADAVLAAARANADAMLRKPDLQPEQVRAAVNQERASEDRAVETERAKADEALLRERAANARRLAALIPLERDRTDQRLLTERARADDALATRDDFLAMVSHDLRDLLGGIVNSAAAIASSITDAEPGTEVRRGVERIERSAGRMARLISDLIDTASIDAGNLRLSSKRHPVDLVVDEALDMWRAQATRMQITLTARAMTDVQVAMDRERILQVLGNLITNAVKFSPIGGTVIVGVVLVGNEVRFSVEDRGVGVPADRLESIFDRFWQVKKDDRRGLGLGLHISRCLVQAHGGKIWVDSEVGVGSTFFFTLPCD